MKYLYVLVYSDANFYIEQTYVSMLSLRQVTPKAYISLLVDDKTAKKQDCSFLNFIKDFVDEFKVVSLDESMPAIAKSRFLKTNMRQYIEGDFLYVDSDTIWASSINEKDFTFDLMGVLDGHCRLKDHPALSYIQSLFKKTNCFPQTEYYLNGGVLYSKDSAFSHDFFSKWHDCWMESSKRGCFVDQPTLNMLLSKESSLEKFFLPGIYNAQIAFSWDYFFEAKIIHFFNSVVEQFAKYRNPYILKNSSFWENFSKNGFNENISHIIDNPLTAFEPGFSIISEDDKNFRKTKTYGLFEDIYRKKINGEKSKFDLIEKMLGIYISIVNKIGK